MMVKSGVYKKWAAQYNDSRETIDPSPS
jgi:hypothetical protein